MTHAKPVMMASASWMPGQVLFPLTGLPLIPGDRFGMAIESAPMVRLEQVSKSYNIALPPYDAVLLLPPRAARPSELAAALTPILGKITAGTLRQVNKMVDLQGHSIQRRQHSSKKRKSSRRCGCANVPVQNT